MVNLNEIRRTAAMVAEEKAELDAAGYELRLEKAKLLEAVIEAMRPALPALCSQVGAGATFSPEGGTTVPASWRGLYVDGEGPTRHLGVAMRGRYGGERLLLRQDGALVILAYDGPCSDVFGEVSSWKTTERVVTVAEASETYDVDLVITRIQRALEAQATGGSPFRAAALREKAARLRALQTLVGSW
jgi:hypothetical protein